MYHFLFILYFICAYESDKTYLKLIFEIYPTWVILPDMNNISKV